MAGPVHGSHSQLLLTSTPNVAFSNEALTNSGDNVTFNMSGAPTKRYWDRTSTLVFQQSSNGSSWNTVTPTSVQHVGGIVIFPSAAGGTNQARIASGGYLPYAAAGEIKDVGFDLSRDIAESTTLTTSSTPTRWRTYKGGLLGGSFKIGKFLADGTYANLATVSTADTLIASIVLDVATTLRLECFGYLQKDGAKAAIGDLEMEDLDFIIDGAVYLTNA